MPDSSGLEARSQVWPLIRVPAALTLAVTLLRLVGELEHWPTVFFDPQAGGGSAIVGITWLAPVFGIYFAVKLERAGAGPDSAGRAAGFGALGAVVVVGGVVFANLVTAPLHLNYLHHRLVYLWVNLAAAGLVTWPGWRALFKVMLAYAYAARVPVAIIMLFAIRGSWGTHYDAAPPDVQFLSWFTEYLWIGFFAQMVFWVGYTLAAGMLCGGVTVLLMRALGRRRAAPAA